MENGFNKACSKLCNQCLSTNIDRLQQHKKPKTEQFLLYHRQIY